MGTAKSRTATRSDTKLTQVKVSVDHRVAAAFKQACAASNISMAAELALFMTEYSNGAAKKKAAPDYSSRRKRRAIVKRMLIELDHIKAAEEQLIENAPENLQEAPVYETAGEYVAALEDAIDLLSTMAP